MGEFEKDRFSRVCPKQNLLMAEQRPEIHSSFLFSSRSPLRSPLSFSLFCFSTLRHGIQQLVVGLVNVWFIIQDRNCSRAAGIKIASYSLSLFSFFSPPFPLFVGSFRWTTPRRTTLQTRIVPFFFLPTNYNSNVEFRVSVRWQYTMEIRWRNTLLFSLFSYKRFSSVRYTVWLVNNDAF